MKKIIKISGFAIIAIAMFFNTSLLTSDNMDSDSVTLNLLSKSHASNGEVCDPTYSYARYYQANSPTGTYVMVNGESEPCRWQRDFKTCLGVGNLTCTRTYSPMICP